MGSQDFLYTFSMALYHKLDVKNGFAFVLQFFSLICDGLVILCKVYVPFFLKKINLLRM